MKKLFKLFVLALICVSLSAVTGLAEDKGKFSTHPKTNDGKKWRVGYYEGGEYINYQQVLTATVNHLMTMGWVEKKLIPPQTGSQTESLWKWLASELKSQYIEFVKNAHYSAQWDNETRKKMADAVIHRLNTRKDIDLMLVMGTKGGQDIANNQHHTPTLVFSSTDAVAAGIVKSAEDSGYDHIFARVNPARYERQIAIFHDIMKFRKLGMVYRDDVSGRSVAAADKAEKVAKEKGFEIISCHIEDISDIAEEKKAVIKCYHELGKKADAIYVSESKSINEDTLPDLVNTLASYKMPSFAQGGSKYVRYGILMSISSRAGFKYVGKFAAETIAKVFNGASPRELDPVFEDPPKIAINLKTAEIIGYNPPVGVFLNAADEVYEEIISP
jgi:ABC-type uncharacterized transport system substrate-binding protein